MRYIDTRGKAAPTHFGEVLLAGTAPGGGLWVPESYPKINLELARRMTYPELATYVIYPYVEEVIAFEDLDKITHEVYSAEKFGTNEITPLEYLQKDLYILQLSNGETRAFKDLAMQFVARLMEHVLERQKRRATIVVSTSGDTGGAAVAAFRGMSQIDVAVLYPKARVSPMQQLMMTTAPESNIHALEVGGTFDDCQAVTKKLFDDKAFCDQYGLAGVNSINWARIMAQVVYWVYAVAQATNRGAKRVILVSPTGNFGNAYSAYIAHESGMPISKIVIATNQNDVMHRLFLSGIYKKGVQVLQSSSPSMDIQVASNIERLFFDLAERNGGVVDALYRDFDKTGWVDVSALMRRLGAGWSSGSASEPDVEEMIRNISKRYGRIIDPHTAAAMYVARSHVDDGTVIVAETAKPEKFSESIKRILNVDLQMPDAWKHLETLPEHIDSVAADAEEVKKLIAAYANA